MLACSPLTMTVSIPRKPCMLPVPYWMDRCWPRFRKVEDLAGSKRWWFSETQTRVSGVPVGIFSLLRQRSLGQEALTDHVRAQSQHWPAARALSSLDPSESNKEKSFFASQFISLTLTVQLLERERKEGRKKERKKKERKEENKKGGKKEGGKEKGKEKKGRKTEKRAHFMGQ